jgi:hypothetical protein
MFTDFGARLPRLVALLEAWTMVFQLIRWVDLHRSLSTRRILKNMMLLRILFASEFQGPGMEILQNEIIGTQTSLVVVN